jgi:serine/threonine protein kinase
MTTMLCPTTDRLKAFYLGELPDEQSDELVSHVGTCATCQAELESGLDVEDSLIVSLREPDTDLELDREPACNAGLLKALGALATANETPDNKERPDDGGLNGKVSYEPNETSLPKSIGEYEILKSLGHGGMGHVYLARHNKLGRMVALKILARHRLGDHRASQRFESEMRVIGRLSHPNIVIAHDAREIDGTAVLVTEYIDGFDLGQLLQRTGPMEIADACEIVRQIALALQYTSDEGFVHRDIKPSNIMVSSTGEVKLLDLGLARLQFGDMESAEITGTGQTMGTADYISPEQVTDSRKVDIRSDLYSLGATLYKLLSGQAPFAGQEYATAFAKMTGHVSTTPGKLRSLRVEVPVELERLVATMLSKRPEDRPQRPDTVARMLSSFSMGCDLRRIVRAASVPSMPIKQSRVNTLSQPSAEPKTQSFFRRPVQLYKAIAAGFFGAVVGFCLGIIITITHPDGTKTTLTIPDGSKIEIAETGKPVNPNVEPIFKTSETNESIVDSLAVSPLPNPSANPILIPKSAKPSPPQNDSLVMKAVTEDDIFVSFTFIEVDVVKLRQQGIDFQAENSPRSVNASFDRAIESLVSSGSAKVSKSGAGTSAGRAITFGKNGLSIEVLPSLKGESGTVRFAIEKGTMSEGAPTPEVANSFESSFQLGKSYAFDTHMGASLENSESSVLVVFSIDWLQSRIEPAKTGAVPSQKQANTFEIDRSSVMKILNGRLSAVMDESDLDQLVSKLALPLALPIENIPNIKNAIRSARPFKGILSIHRGLTSKDTNWLCTEHDIVYTVKVSPEELFADVCSFVNGWTGDKSILEQILDGLENDPLGPRIKIDRDVLPLLSNEITIVASGSIVAFRLKQGMGEEMLVGLNRAIASDGEKVRIVSDFLLFGMNADLDAATERYNRYNRQK